MTKKPTFELKPDVSLPAESMDGSVVANGMRLKLRKPRPVAELRLVSIVGREDAKNEVYMNLVGPLLWIEEIDGEPLGVIMSKRELEALFDRLGDDGLSVIVKHIGSMLSTDASETGADAKN